jgi:hypothetical protein
MAKDVRFLHDVDMSHDRQSICLRAVVDGHRMVCRVPIAFIGRHFKTSCDWPQDAFDRNRPAIEALVRQRIEDGTLSSSDNSL